MLGWVLDTVRRAGCGRTLVVVGHGADRVQETMAAADVGDDQYGSGASINAGPNVAVPSLDLMQRSVAINAGPNVAVASLDVMRNGGDDSAGPNAGLAPAWADR